MTPEYQALANRLDRMASMSHDELFSLLEDEWDYFHSHENVSDDWSYLTQIIISLHVMNGLILRQKEE